MKKENVYAREFTERMKIYGLFDVYDIDNMFPAINSQVAHARKKLLQAGGRLGGKTALQDIKEAYWSLGEAIKEMESEEKL